MTPEQERRKIVESVRADLEIEGLIATPEEIEEDERYIRGEITMEQRRENYTKKLERLRVEHPEYFEQKNK